MTPTTTPDRTAPSGNPGRARKRRRRRWVLGILVLVLVAAGIWGKVETDRIDGEADQFAEIPHSTKVTGSPVLNECLAYIDCKIWARYDAGDHTLFLGEVQEAALNDDPSLKPLLFFSSKYRTLADEESL